MTNTLVSIAFKTTLTHHDLWVVIGYGQQISDILQEFAAILYLVSGNDISYPGVFKVEFVSYLENSSAHEIIAVYLMDDKGICQMSTI